MVAIYRMGWNRSKLLKSLRERGKRLRDTSEGIIKATDYHPKEDESPQ